MVFVVVAVSTAAVFASADPWATPRLVARARVAGVGVSFRADSAERCLQICRRHPDACDGVNYNAAAHKCRLLARCAPSKLAYEHPDYQHFSSRPHGTYKLKRVRNRRILPTIIMKWFKQRSRPLIIALIARKIWKG